MLNRLSLKSVIEKGNYLMAQLESAASTTAEKKGPKQSPRFFRDDLKVLLKITGDNALCQLTTCNKNGNLGVAKGTKETPLEWNYPAMEVIIQDLQGKVLDTVEVESGPDNLTPFAAGGLYFAIPIAVAKALSQKGYLLSVAESDARIRSKSELKTVETAW